MTSNYFLTDVPKELFLIILHNFSLKKLLEFGLVSKYFLFVVKNSRWINVMPWIGSIMESVIFFIENYKFTKYGFKGNFITNDVLKNFSKLNLSQISVESCPLLTKECLQYFKNCDTISIFNSLILHNDDLKYFSNCKKIKIEHSYGNIITSECLKYLTNCEDLDIVFTQSTNISDENIQLFNNLHTLTLGRFLFTNDNFMCLSKITNLNLSYYPNKITSENITFFANCHTLNLSSCVMLNDINFHPLTKLHTLVLDYSNTDDVIIKKLSNLTTLTDLSLRHCKKITDDSIYVLKNLTMFNLSTLNLSQCYKITDKGVKTLGRLRKLNLYKCMNITNESIKKLKNLHTIIIDECINITNQPLFLLTKCHLISVFGCYKITLIRENIVYHRKYAWDDELFR